MHFVILLPRDGIFFQQFLIACGLASGIGQLYAGFFNAGVVHLQVVGHCSHAGRGDLLAGSGVSQIGFSLGQLQFEFGVFNKEQGVTFVYGLVFFKTYFADKTLNAGVYGSNVLAYLRIVGIFHARVDETGTYVDCSCCQKQDDEGIVKCFPYFFC